MAVVERRKQPRTDAFIIDVMLKQRSLNAEVKLMAQTLVKKPDEISALDMNLLENIIQNANQIPGLKDLKS